MIAAECKRCKTIGCNGDTTFCNNKGEIKRHLENKFILEEENLYKSKNKWLGAGTGDDSTLYVYFDEVCTNIWWKENRGFEKTIFDGRAMRSIEEFEKLFDFLDLKIYLKW